ncbi:MAG: hypothetical protein Q9212_002784 [Teloschistes hypoglaucus]
MSEARTRPSGPRGRGSGRGGRGGHSSRGGRGPSRGPNGDGSDSPMPPAMEDTGELGDLKRLYSTQLSTIKEMFPDWTDEDVVFALQETDGNLEATIDRISEGNVSQWGEVKKKTKERSQPKPKDGGPSTADSAQATTRGGRGRGVIEGSRGRGRGADRGRGTARAGRGPSTVSGSRPAAVEKATMETGIVGSWNDDVAADGATSKGAETDNVALDSSWEHITPAEAATPAPQEPAKPSLVPDGTRSWASMFNRPAPAPVPKKPSRETTIEEAPPEQPPAAEENIMPALPPPIPVETINPDVPNTPPSPGMVSSEPAVELTPPKDELTETNLEQVLDTSGPVNSATAASTVASTLDGRTGTGTPLQPSAQLAPSRPPMGGYQTSAYKATGMPGRSASFQRKILEQREAVVMPGKHAVDRAAVQFGTMGLNGSNEDLDVDDDREEPETRAQPPQHSPVAPKATLPPSAQSQLPLTSEHLPAPRQAPGLPPVNQQSAQHPSGDQDSIGQLNQSSYQYNQYTGRFGPPPTSQEPSAPVQKPYEPFGSQIQQPQPQHPFDGYPSTSQGQQSSQHSASTHLGGLSSAPLGMSSYYTSDEQRNSYNQYYGNYGQQPQQTSQDAGTTQHRAPSALGTSSAEQTSQHAPSQPQPSYPSRYGQPGDTQNSGSSTPNPSLLGHGQQNQAPQLPHQQGPQGQSGGQHGGYPYGHPYYPSPYYQAYMNQVSDHAYGRDRPMFDDVRRYDEQFLTHNAQFGYGGGQGGYGAPFGGGGGKQGMYGQPHQGYGMSTQSPYDQHAQSPANLGGFGHQQSGPGREGAASTTASGYNRTGSTQPSDHQQQQPGGGSSGYGGMSDAFGRSATGFQGQSHGLGHQPSGEDSFRAFGDSSKVPGGPSPAPPGARPGSAMNNLQSQSGLPPSQNQSQQGYGGYPGHLNHQMHGQQGSQYGAGPGGLGGHHQSSGQGHQGGGYGGYGGGFGGNSYGYSRGGWAGNYGH